MSSVSTFRKRDSRPGAIDYEVAGLVWLEQAEGRGGVPVVPILGHGPGWLEEERLEDGPASAAAAEEFGRRLAHTHAAGATHFGAPPAGFQGDAWMGKAPLALPATPAESEASWGAYYARFRLRPYLARAPFTSSERALMRRLCDTLESGSLDHPQPGLVAAAHHPAARTHGDLWGGNVMWTRRGAVLIDPAAQGGHAEEDLADLGVFGAPHLERIRAAYNEVSPLADGWRERIGLHQLHMLVIHCYLFGRSYVPQTVDIARRYA